MVTNRLLCRSLHVFLYKMGEVKLLFGMEYVLRVSFSYDMEGDNGGRGVDGGGEDSVCTFLTKVYFAIHPSFSLSTNPVRCKRCPTQVAMDSTTSSSSPGTAIETIEIFNLRARSSFLLWSLSYSK